MTGGTPRMVEGEVLPPVRTAIYQPSPFALANPVRIEIKEGDTLAQIVAQTGVPAALWNHLVIEIDGNRIYRESWRLVKPKQNAIITIRAVPGGKGVKNVLRIVLVVALVVAVAYFAPQITPWLVASVSTTAAGSAAVIGAATALVSTALTFVGMLIINALVPPQYGNGSGADDPRFSLTGSSNRYAPYSNIPRVFGKWRLYPPLAARPFTETFGDDQFLRMLLVVGFGPLKISELRIGETPLSAFQGVEVQITEGGPPGWAGNVPITLFNRQVREESVNAPLTEFLDVIRTTFDETVEINVTIGFPGGLVKFNKKQDKEDFLVDISVQYRASGTLGAWINANWADNLEGNTGTNGRLRTTGRSLSVVRTTGRWRVPQGRYDVKLNRTTAKSNDTAVVDTVGWETLRSIRNEQAVNQTGVAMIAIRMRASEQLNGAPQTINCVAESYLPVRNPTTFNWSYQLTGNNAWVYADLLRRRGPQTMLGDIRIDLPTIQEWAADCAAQAPNAVEPRWTYNGVIEGGSIFEALRRVASAGRASFALKDGKYSVIRDVPQTVPVQHITPRNSWGYEGSKRFVEIPHALRVRFINAAANYQTDEVVAYDDGYTALNATLYETIDVQGATTSTAAWREGRYFIAAGKLRPEEHRVSMDIESLRCTMGDLVRFSHDVILVGLAHGRITGLVDHDASLFGRFILDQEIQIEAGKSYSLRIRKRNGVTVLYTVDVAGMGAGVFEQVWLSPKAPKSDGVQVGDLFMFGETALEAIPCIVRRIEPGDNLSAGLTLVEADPAIWTADSGPIPAFSSKITTQGPPGQRRPGSVGFVLRSGATVVDNLGAGATTQRIAVDILPPVSSEDPLVFYEVQWREAGGNGRWTTSGQFPVGTGTYFAEPVRVGASYDVRVRGIFGNQMASEWTAILDYLVLGKNVAPDSPTALTVTAGYRAVTLKWSAPNDLDLSYYNVRYAATNSYAGSTIIARVGGTTFVDTPVVAGVVRYYWIEAVDLSGNVSAPSLAGGMPATGLSIADIEGIGADDKLSPDEKLDIVREKLELDAEVTALQALAVGVPAALTSATAHAAALVTLNTYLAGLAPAWNNTATITPIVRATWNSAWANYYAARDALDNLVKKGAPGGTFVAGQPAERLLLTNDVEINETFSRYTTVAEVAANWTVGGVGEYSLVTTTDTGGKAIQAGNNSSPDHTSWICKKAIPYAPEDLYRVSFDVEVVNIAGQQIFLGLSAVDGTGANLPSDTGSYHYVAAALVPTVGRRVYTGYVRGLAAKGTGAGVGALSPDPVGSSPVAIGAVAIAPLMLLGYSTGNSKIIIHAVTLRKVEDISGLPQGPWSNLKTYDSGDVISYLGRGFYSRRNGNLNKAPPSSNTSDLWWLLIGASGANGNPGSNGLPGIDSLEVSAQPAARAISVNAAGVPNVNQLPKTIQFSVFKGLGNLTSVSTYAYTAQNCSITDLGLGTVSVTAMADNDASVAVVASYAGQSGKATATMTKVRDGFGAVSTSNVANPTNSTTAIIVSSRSLGVGPSGTVTVSLSMTIRPVGGLGAVTTTQAAQAFYRTTPGSGPWVSMGAEVISSVASRGPDIAPGEPGEVTAGSINFTRTIAGPLSVSNWEFAIFARWNGGSAAPQTLGGTMLVSFAP